MTKTGSEDVIVRLKRIEGQVRGVQKMVANNADCTEILNQVAAIRSAISRVGVLVFESHAQDCIAKSVQGGSQNFDEIIAMMRRFIK